MSDENRASDRNSEFDANNISDGNRKPWKELQLIFEQSRPGRENHLLPEGDLPAYRLPDRYRRRQPLRLPQIAESDLARHYTALAERTHGVNRGFYPLGSCTMKYNPKINEDAAALPGFTDVHPLQPDETVQGCLAVLTEAERFLAEMTGMDAVSFQAAAGAQGEFLGLLMIKVWHRSRGDRKRTKILVPDAAHGTNPATVSMCGMDAVSIPSDEKGNVDLAALKQALSRETAGLMLTNPNTLGKFDEQILEVTAAVHQAGGLNYYDGANLNAVMGIARPGDMGFDVIHMNLHKTFSTPHGGGGPGAGAVGCRDILRPFLPAGQVTQAEGQPCRMTPPQSIGRVKAFDGNFLVVVKALAYLYSLGGDGLRDAARSAVLNANYLQQALTGRFDAATDGFCMHEFVLGVESLRKQTGVTAMDIAKALLDYGIHPPTVYFPLIVPEALMIEPTETESPETLDRAIRAFQEIYDRALTDPEALMTAPHTTPVRRPDEVLAARSPKLRFEFREFKETEA